MLRERPLLDISSDDDDREPNVQKSISIAELKKLGIESLKVHRKYKLLQYWKML